jgi:hypothetical protein
VPIKPAFGRILLIAVLALLIASARISLADTWKGRELEALWRKAPWHFGPLKIQPAIVLSNMGVDSNIYYSPSEPIKDYTMTAGPAVTFYLPIYRKFILSGTASPQYVYYVKTARERTWNYYLTGSAALSLRRVFLAFDWKYSDARERWNTEIDIRPRRKEDGLGGSFLVQTSYRTSLSVGFRQAKYDYENLNFDLFNVRDRLNRKEQYVDLSAYYQVTTRTKFLLDFEYGMFKFDFADTAAFKDSRSRAAYGGLEFSPTGRIRGKARVGYKIFDIKNPEGTDYQGVVGDAQISVRLAKPLVVRASCTRDVNFSLWYNNAYYLGSTIGPGASLYVLRFVRLDYDYSLGRNRYPEAQPEGGGGGANVKRLDDFRIHSVGIYFRIKKNVALGVIGSRWVRISNLAYENDKRYFLGLNLTYDF